MDDCIFCKIAIGEIPANIFYADHTALAFADLHPQAPTHLLVIPREHIVSLAEATDANLALLGHLQLVAAKVARQAGLQQGFRTVMNVGADGGQTVSHLHIHVRGGGAMHWPPG